MVQMEKLKGRDASFIGEEAPRPGDICSTGRNYKQMAKSVKDF
jgi:hypothetical protein